MTDSPIAHACLLEQLNTFPAPQKPYRSVFNTIRTGVLVGGGLCLIGGEVFNTMPPFLSTTLAFGVGVAWCLLLFEATVRPNLWAAEHVVWATEAQKLKKLEIQMMEHDPSLKSVFEYLHAQESSSEQMVHYVKTLRNYHNSISVKTETDGVKTFFHRFLKI